MCSNVVYMFFDAYKVSFFFQIFYDCFSCFVAIHSGISSVSFYDGSIIIQDVDFRKIMSLSYFKVIRVMCRCDLNRTCSEFFINVSVCHDRDFSSN